MNDYWTLKQTNGFYFVKPSVFTYIIFFMKFNKTNGFYFVKPSVFTYINFFMKFNKSGMALKSVIMYSTFF